VRSMNTCTGGAGEDGAGAEWVREQEDKLLGLVAYKEPIGFSLGFYTIFYFDEFCRTRYFEFLNSVLP
jgi:hypothetical protein